MNTHLLIGDRQAGKTSVCQRLVQAARARGLRVGGIIAPAVYNGRECVGYRVIDLTTGRSATLATLAGPGAEQVGRFHFTAEGLTLGRTALNEAAGSPLDLVVVDEVGPLELAGGGWSEPVDRLLGRVGGTLLTVRRSLATRVAQRWSVPPKSTHDLLRGAEETVAAILARLGS